MECVSIPSFLSSSNVAPPLHDDGIPPGAVDVLGDLFSGADQAEAAFFVELHAAGVVWEDGGIDGPVAGFFCFFAEPRQEGGADAFSGVGQVYVDAVFYHAPEVGLGGGGGDHGEADYLSFQLVDQAAVGEVVCVPFFASGAVLIEGGFAGGEALGVDLKHSEQVGRQHGSDHGELLLDVDDGGAVEYFGDRHDQCAHWSWR